MLEYLKDGYLPEDPQFAHKIAAESCIFGILDGLLSFVDQKKPHRRRVVVPRHLRKQLLEETHSSKFGGHFAGYRLYGSLSDKWWWNGMYVDCVEFTKNCPKCLTATGSVRHFQAPIHPIPIQRPFQMVGVDVMELPGTEQGNKYVVVFQDLFTKWPMVYAVPDQKTIRITWLLIEQIIPFFGISENQLSDCGTNFLSQLIMDLCEILGIKKITP